jgi:hypothetical protein
MHPFVNVLRSTEGQLTQHNRLLQWKLNGEVIQKLLLT